jgi:predicted  nucleic acid-binding Zn-ribbon protein
LSHRCPACGGPISDGGTGLTLACLWCGEQYAVEKGELLPKPEDPLLRPSKPKMSEFYAIRSHQ